MIFYILLACFVTVHGNGMIHHAHQPQPYSFGYTIKDHEGVQHRQEAGNGAGVVKGNYGFIDNKGIRRQVDYIADHAGFRAQVKTNEPGTAGQSPAAVNMISNDPYAHGAAVPYVSRVNDHVVPALYESDGAYGFPTLYGHRVSGHKYHEPTPGYKFITPVHEPRHHLSIHQDDHHMPVHHDLHMPVHHEVHHKPVYHEDHHMPVHHRHHMPVYQDEHHMPIHHDNHMPVHHRHHHIPAHVPVHDHHAPAHMPVYPTHPPLNINGHGYNQMQGSRYMGGLAHSQILGAGYRGHGGVVNFGANLIGGVIRGHDSRFTNL